MKRFAVPLTALLFTLAGVLPGLWAEEKPAAKLSAEAPFIRAEDIIYGRKFGTALTLDVFTPRKNANGAAIVWVISGGWFSSHDSIHPGYIQEFLKRGYTVFAVVHGSNPRFTIPEAVADMKRAVRFIRFNAKRFHIDPNRIGVTGGSAGGHLSLMLGTTGDNGDAKAKDPVEQASSGVQAVACFFPPTDFLNWGKKGEVALGKGKLAGLRAPFDFQELDPKSRTFVHITDEKRVQDIGRQISPLYHVSQRSAPALIIHGDIDRVVPLQQAEAILARFKEMEVPAKLIVKKGADHGWPHMEKDVVTLADWFDQYLAKK